MSLCWPHFGVHIKAIRSKLWLWTAIGHTAYSNAFLIAELPSESNSSHLLHSIHKWQTNCHLDPKIKWETRRQSHIRQRETWQLFLYIFPAISSICTANPSVCPCCPEISSQLCNLYNLLFFHSVGRRIWRWWHYPSVISSKRVLLCTCSTIK